MAVPEANSDGQRVQRFAVPLLSLFKTCCGYGAPGFSCYAVFGAPF